MFHKGNEEDAARDVELVTGAEGREWIRAYDVFLSYSTKDRETVVQLAEALVAVGIRPWLDVWELVPGQPWQTGLNKAIQNVTAAAVCVGPSGMGAWQDHEVMALIRQFVERKSPVIPVLLPGATHVLLPPLLKSFLWVDLREFSSINTHPLSSLVAGILGKAPREMEPRHLHSESTSALRKIESSPAEDRVDPIPSNLDLQDTGRQFDSLIRRARDWKTSRPPIPDQYFIPAIEIDQVIGDLRLQLDGHYVLYTVDPAEIVDYCFPLEPVYTTSPELDRIAADQTALDQVFTKGRYRPILIPHYVQELSRIYSYVSNTVDSAWQELELCRRMMEGVDGSTDALGEGSSEELLTRVSQNFVRKLAVWMGIDSMGAARFQQVVSMRLKRLSDLGAPYIDEVANTLVPCHAPDIFRILAGELGGDPTVARRRSALTDASAIDWLINLNAACEKGFLDGKLRSRYIFLYLSSAHRSEKVFSAKTVQVALPIIDGRPFSFWRSRRQLLLLASASRNAGEDIAEIIDNLQSLRHLRGTLADMEKKFAATGASECGSCVLRGGIGFPGCIWKGVCEKVRSIGEASNEIANLGLVARIRAYRDLLRASPKLQGQKEFLETLRTLVNNKELPDLAARQIEDRQLFALTTSSATQEFLDGESGQQRAKDSISS